MDRMLRLNVFGPFALVGPDGQQVDFPSRKAQALLAYLATERERKPTREQLATLLWSRTGEERARHNLRQALSKIRACCGDLITAHGGLVTLDTTACTVDVIEFERLVASDDPEELGRGLGLFRGELLEGYAPREAACEEWLLIARSRLRRLACDANDRYVRMLVEREHLEEAIAGLNRRLTIDPACEPAHALLMELLERTGRRSDALRQYQVCVAELRRDLNVEPGATTQALYQRIRDASSGPDGAPVPKTATHEPRATRARPTVAVLPFENLADATDDYFVDGIVEDLTTALSHFHSLQVIARGSSFHYRDRDLPDRQIADELDAQYLVRGSVQRSGERVRVHVRLLDAVAGPQLWGHRFDSRMEDVFALQDEITSTLVAMLADKVESARLERTRAVPQERLDAYDILLRGKEHHHRFTADDCKACIDLFEQAIERDPGYALAYSWLACGLGQAIVFDLDEPSSLVDRSQVAAERGLTLDENDAESHRVLAQIFLTRRDLNRSIRHQERALLLNPNDNESICSMGEILSYLGRHAEAEGWVRKSMRLNPYHPERYWTHLARPLFHLGRFAEALEALEHIGRLRMDDHGYRVAAAFSLGERPLLKKCYRELREAFPDLEPDTFAESLPYAQESDRAQVREALYGAFDSMASSPP
jgi:TolB-like protein